MRKINVELNQKSIQNAIKELTQIKNLFTKSTIVQEFLEELCEWIIKRANWHLNQSSIGENVKIDIRNGWEYTVNRNSAQIINSTAQAVFVEFGVGIVGSYNSHPQADIEGYGYNVITANSQPSKKSKGVWIFKTNDIDNIDMRSNRYSTQTTKSGDIKVITKGSTPVMYAYNAIVDAKMELQNPNSELSQKWNKLIKRYIG